MRIVFKITDEYVRIYIKTFDITDHNSGYYALSCLLFKVELFRRLDCFLIFRLILLSWKQSTVLDPVSRPENK
jgi:hypothetical protein